MWGGNNVFFILHNLAKNFLLNFLHSRKKILSNFFTGCKKRKGFLLRILLSEIKPSFSSNLLTYEKK